MTQKMTIIYLHSLEPLQAGWVVTDEKGHVTQTITRGHLSELSDFAKENEIIVLVPAQDVLLTHATLPEMNRQQLMQALPFALEEQLIEDVGELHFAITAPLSDGVIPVAVISKQKMDEWLTLFKQHELEVTKMISTVFALPCKEKNWYASIHENTAVIRTAEYSGFACDKNNLDTFLHIKSSEEKEKKPEHIYLYNLSSSLPEIKIDAVVLNETPISEQLFLEKISESLDAYPTINLLQGAYQAKHKATETKKIWRTAGIVAFAWIGLALLGNVISFFMLHHQLNGQDKIISAIYKRNFPDATSIITPRERMERKLKNLQEKTGKNYFLALLAKTGKDISQSPAIQLNSLDFRDNQLNLDVSAATFDDLDALTKKLSQGNNISVKQQNAAIAGTRVKATLQIKQGTT